jgi:hypothetical protein
MVKSSDSEDDDDSDADDSDEEDNLSEQEGDKNSNALKDSSDEETGTFLPSLTGTRGKQMVKSSDSEDDDDSDADDSDEEDSLSEQKREKDSNALKDSSDEETVTFLPSLTATRRKQMVKNSDGNLCVYSRVS